MIIDGRYRLEESIGGGGMGTVYRGLQLTVGREVAIKLIRPEFAQDPDSRTRFLREIKHASELEHPHIVRVFDFGETPDGGLFLVMELVRGPTLIALLRRHGTLDPARVARLGGQLAGALSAAHRQGVVHRDLKLSNLMCQEEPEPGKEHLKILDFGLARRYQGEELAVTRAGAIVGTPRYLAPEAAMGKTSGPAGDLYSLGVVLYELSSGRWPYRAQSPQEALWAHVHAAPAPLPESIPPELSRLVMHLLRKDPADRPSSAEAVQAALEAVVLELSPAPIPTPLGTTPLRAWSADAPTPAAFTASDVEGLPPAHLSTPAPRRGLAERALRPLTVLAAILAALLTVVSLVLARGTADPSASVPAPATGAAPEDAPLGAGPRLATTPGRTSPRLPEITPHPGDAAPPAALPPPGAGPPRLDTARTGPRPRTRPGEASPPAAGRVAAEPPSPAPPPGPPEAAPPADTLLPRLDALITRARDLRGRPTGEADTRAALERVLVQLQRHRASVRVAEETAAIAALERELLRLEAAW